MSNFDTSLLNSKNSNNSEKCYETVRIHFQLERKNYLYKCSRGVFRTSITSTMEVSVIIVNIGTPLNCCYKEIHLRHCRSASQYRTSKILHQQSTCDEDKRGNCHKWNQPLTLFLKKLFLIYKILREKFGL